MNGVSYIRRRLLHAYRRHHKCSYRINSRTGTPRRRAGTGQTSSYHWVTQEQMHEQYLSKGQTYKELIKLRHKTAQIRQHSKTLTRTRWTEHFASFNSRTGLAKLWTTFTALQGKSRTPNIVPTVPLLQNKSLEDIEEEAARIFCPQPATPPRQLLYVTEELDESNPIESLFTMAELVMALDQVRVKSAS